MDISTWVQALAGPALMLIGGLITWLIKARTEELRAIQERLRSDQRKIYAELLEPYILIMGGAEKDDQKKKAIKRVLSYDYRKTGFELLQIGSDGTVRAFGDLLQYVSNTEEDPNPAELMPIWGRLLLEMRRSLWNKKTKLNEIDMLRAHIKGVDETFISS